MQRRVQHSRLCPQPLWVWPEAVLVMLLGFWETIKMGRPAESGGTGSAVKHQTEAVLAPRRGIVRRSE